MILHSDPINIEELTLERVLSNLLKALENGVPRTAKFYTASNRLNMSSQIVLAWDE